MSEIPIERGIKIVHGTYNAETGVVTYFAQRTNGDRVRCMGDEELAAFMTDDLCELLCHSPLVCDGNCEVRMLSWLRQEAEL